MGDEKKPGNAPLLTSQPTSQSSKRESIQVAPSSNFLRHNQSGWCFIESSPPCCGMMPRQMENSLIHIIHGNTCCNTQAGATPDGLLQSRSAEEHIEMHDVDMTGD